MKTTTFIASVAFLGLQAFALADTTPTTSPTSTSTNPCCSDCGTECPPPTMTPQGSVQSCGQEWLNVETITLEAANGNPIAQYTLAYLTDTGTQMPQDSAKAADMYAAARPGLEKAAAAGDPAACRALAHMCMTGKGCEKDPKKAKEYMKKCKACCAKPTATQPAMNMTTEEADTEPETDTTPASAPAN